MNNNKMYDELFRGFNKADAFDKIAEMFYNRNYGTAGKADIELLMFSFYLDASIEKYKDQDGVLDYVKASDYEIAKQLGIKQNQVRNLKVKKQARYPVEYDWKKSLKSIEKNIRYDGKKIIIPISDPNLMIEIKNFIAEKGGYIEFESGTDQIRMRIEYYLTLMYENFDETEKKKFLKKLKKEFGDKNINEGDLEQMDKKEIVNYILSIANEGLGAVNGILDLINPENTLASILRTVLKLQ